MLYEYKCKKCGKEQEKMVKLSEGNTKEPCDQCNAPAEELERILSATPKHGSWAHWRANLQG